jgi:mannose/cellobiose epimerase-like protein (N-acyl-D-glucosamine 2-epimerase family)
MADPRPDFRLAEVERWMFEAALPFWSGPGRDVAGRGFVEQVGFDGKPVDLGFKRMRVQARQVYTFCHAAELGWDGPARASAAHGIDFIRRHGWMEGGGWARRFADDGRQLDQTLDAYEQAFVLFAFGWYYRLTRDADILAEAHRTLDTMHRRLDHPAGHGFLTQTPDCAELQQNPHMHFLEAMLVWYEATGEARFAQEAQAIVAHLRGRMFQAKIGVLPEFYDMDWTPLPHEGGAVVEPGHHFEWTWLLAQYTRITGEPTGDIAAALFAFAHKFGSSEDGVIYDALLAEGSILRADHRTWPQTEALKAYMARSEFAAEDRDAEIAQLVSILLDRYLATDIPGLWIDHLNAELAPLSKTVPASTLYHVFLAFAELQRWLKIA